MSKNLSFDASEVTTTARTGSYFTVNLDTDYIDEILANFTPDEIILEYDQLDKLYEALKEHYGD